MATAKKHLTPEQLADRRHWAEIVAQFVEEIGIPVTRVIQGSADAEGVLPRVKVDKGGLVLDIAEVFPGDILHECAHLSVIPAEFRGLANKTLKTAMDAMRAHLEEHGHGLATWPEDPLCRAILQCDEPEATAWQYAAAVHLKLPEQWLFPPGSFGGTSQALLHSLKANSYLGINGLQAAGWTLVRENPHRSLPVYPRMAFWLHPGAQAVSGV